MDESTAVGLFGGLRIARVLALIGLVAGGIAGIFAFLTQDGAGAVALRAASVFPLLVILLPGTLALVTWAAVEGGEPTLTAILRQLYPARVMLLTGGICGSAAGCLAFLLAATLMPGSIGGEDLNQVRIALFAAVGWAQPLFVLVGTAVVAVALSWWANKRLSR
ncbi:MAG: hypothetical protein IPK52_07625 [Chloroflexi bacterium]|nr:hypothetical protein [Chloroflexota bacterium]